MYLYFLEEQSSAILQYCKRFNMANKFKRYEGMMHFFGHEVMVTRVDSVKTYECEKHYSLSAL